MKILMALTLMFAVVAPSFASENFYCEDIYVRKMKQNRKTSSRIENSAVLPGASAGMIILAGPISSGPLFLAGLGLGLSVYSYAMFKDNQAARHELLIASILEAQIGGRAYRDEVERLIGASNYQYQSGIEYLLEEINRSRSIDEELTYDELAQRLVELAPTDEFCPKGKPLSFRKIKKLI